MVEKHIPIILEPLSQSPNRNMRPELGDRGQSASGMSGQVMPVGGQSISNTDGMDGIPGAAKDVERANVGLVS